MGLIWHLNALLATRRLTADDLASRLSFPLGAEFWAETPPEAMTMDDLAAFCQALDCQPGELLSFAPESPADQARRELARNASYQSFLAFREGAGDELDDEAEW